MSRDWLNRAIRTPLEVLYETRLHREQANTHVDSLFHSTRYMSLCAGHRLRTSLINLDQIQASILSGQHAKQL